MWLMTRMAIVFYVSIIWFSSLAIILFVLHVIDLATINKFLYLVYNDGKVAAVTFGIACGVILMSVILENLIYGTRRRERNIAFQNANGPVSVSLTALEDLIKRLNAQIPEIKEIRPFVVALRKGLDIDIKLVLRQEANIPDLTSRLTDLVRRKIEESIGMEGKINVRIHVIKFNLEEGKVKTLDSGFGTQVPFHGYRS